LYLHGFASAPSSTKAKFFAAKLAELGIVTQIPDLNGESFQRLTLSSQLAIIDELVSKKPDEQPSAIVGSSMGGLLATICSRRYPGVKALVLMAPGFGLPRRWQELLGEEGLTKWHTNGFLDVFHYGANENNSLSYDFILDAERYQTDNLEVTIPTLVFHGKNDETVPLSESLDFAKQNPAHVELKVLDSDHSLIDKLDEIWADTLKFLGTHCLSAPAGLRRPF
jgi:pimeloyl-ACP methyl ester carboxylesterase